MTVADVCQPTRGLPHPTAQSQVQSTIKGWRALNVCTSSARECPTGPPIGRGGPEIAVEARPPIPRIGAGAWWRPRTLQDEHARLSATELRALAQRPSRLGSLSSDVGGVIVPSARR